VNVADVEDVLLLFDEGRSCWTETMAELVEPGSGDKLKGLLEEGLLARDGEVYFLTRAGAERFRLAAEEFFLPLRPGLPGAGDRRREANRTLLQMLLDRRHLQRWGLKEYCKPFRFVVPDLRDEELFSTLDEADAGSAKKLSWRYPEHPVFVNMARDFPLVGLTAREESPPAPGRLAAWMSENVPRGRVMEADLLYKSRYDFQAYAHFPKLPGDPCGLLNTDRFLFFFAPPPDPPENVPALLTTLGEFHMFLTMLRRMYLPGYVDRDSLDQDGINWLVYVYENECDALRCAERLAPFGRALAGPGRAARGLEPEPGSPLEPRGSRDDPRPPA
jgi:hypothetical protein